MTLVNDYDYADLARERVSEEAIQAYERDGAVILRNVVPELWIERMRVAIDAVLADPDATGTENEAEGSKGRFYGDTFLWLRNPEFRAFLFDSPLAALAQRMMRSHKVNVFYEQLLVKEPGTAARTPWHQDLPYWPVGGWQITSLWVPFDLATPDTGAVTYIRGSHLWGKLYQPRAFGQQSISMKQVYEEAPDVDANPENFEFVSGVLYPGDVFVHHAKTLHGAPGNSSATLRRRALATRWTGDDAYFDPRATSFLNHPKYAPIKARIPLSAGDPLDCEIFPRLLP